MNHLLFNRNPLRFSGGSCSSHVPAIDPEDTDQKLGRLPAGSVCEIKSTPSTEQQTTQNHPKTSNTPIFLGENLGGFGGLHPIPPVFFLGKKRAKSKVKRPPWTFHPLGNPQPNPRSRKRIQDLYKKWGGDSEDGITIFSHEFLVGKKNPCKKV